MKIRGQRILVFGDDYSVQGDDKAPGAILAQLLLEQGAQVQLDAAKGRSAVSFWMPQHEGQDPPDQLIAQDIAFDPTQVIVMLGSNDLGLDTQADTDAFTALKQSFPKAEVWAVGPPNFADPNMNTQAAVVYQTLTNVFGADHVFDLRPLTIHADRASDGIHFTPASANQIAQALTATFAAASPLTWGKAILWGLGIGAAVAAGLYLLRRESKTLEGMNMVMDAAGEEEIEIEGGEEIGIDPDDPSIIEAEAVEVESVGLGRPMLEGAKAKAKDRIRLPSGDEMTLGEALDKGLVTLIENTYYDPPRYFARSTDGEVSWEVGKTLWLSRTGGKLPFDGLHGSKETPVAMVRFASNDARSRFLKAYRERLSEAGYEPHQIPDVIWAQFSEPGLTAYISGTDDIDRVRDVAHEVRGVLVKDRPDLGGLDGLEGKPIKPTTKLQRAYTKADRAASNASLAVYDAKERGFGPDVIEQLEKHARELHERAAELAEQIGVPQLVQHHRDKAAGKTPFDGPAGFDGIKIGTKDPATMTASAINKELDKLDARSSELTDEFIAAGRGHERPSDIQHMTDPLAVEQNAIWDRRRDLRNEIELRYGPRAPSRFPTGDPKYRGYFKPRKTASDGLEGSGLYNEMGDELTNEDFQQAARFDQKRFGLTHEEALKLVTRQTSEYKDLLSKIEAWREKHGYPAQNSALTRGYVLSLIGLKSSKRKLSGVESNLPPDVLKKWKSKASAYKRAIAKLAAGDDPDDAFTKAVRARDALSKVADLASQHAGSWDSPLVHQVNAMTDELIKEHPIAEARDRGRDARYEMQKAKSKRLDEEIREKNRPYEWMKKFHGAEPP